MITSEYTSNLEKRAQNIISRRANLSECSRLVEHDHWQRYVDAFVFQKWSIASIYFHVRAT